MLLPGEDSAVRPRLMQWFEKLEVIPRIVGKCDDGALLKAFGHVGIGIFPAPSVITKEVRLQYGLVAIGHTSTVTKQFYAIYCLG